MYMEKSGMLIRPNDLLAIIVIIIGGLGFIFWGIGILTI